MHEHIIRVSFFLRSSCSALIGLCLCRLYCGFLFGFLSSPFPSCPWWGIGSWWGVSCIYSCGEGRWWIYQTLLASSSSRQVSVSSFCSQISGFCCVRCRVWLDGWMAGWLVGGINPGLDWMGVCKQVDIRTTKQASWRGRFTKWIQHYTQLCGETHNESVDRGQRFVGDCASGMS